MSAYIVAPWVKDPPTPDELLGGPRDRAAEFNALLNPEQEWDALMAKAARHG